MSVEYGMAGNAMDNDGLNRTAQEWFEVLARPDVQPEAVFGHRQRVARILGISTVEAAQSSDLDDTMQQLGMVGRIDLGQAEFTLEEKLALRAGRDIVRRTFADAAEEQVYNTQIERDPMTGLYNTQGRDRQLPRLLFTSVTGERRGRQSQGIFVGMADATSFKRINDLISHEVGDECIIEAARMLEDSIRPGDVPVISHRSGDEFDIVLGDISPDDLQAAEERIFQAQAAKVADGRYATAWNSIRGFRKICQEQSVPYRPSVRLERNTQNELARFLYINGSRIAPLNSIVVLALGFNNESLASLDDYKAHSTQAEIRMDTRKAQLHELMGGADR